MTQKIETDTNTNIPLLKVNFFPIARNGLCDEANAYVHSMAWFKDHLYIGLTRYVYVGSRPYNLGREFDIFPVKVPRFNWEIDRRAQIWRYCPREAKWENVHISPMCMGSKGFEVPRHIGFRDMAVFQGMSDDDPALYVTSWGSHMGLGPFILRCNDGKHFEEVGVSERQYFGAQTLRALISFKGKLYTIPTSRDSGIDGTQNFRRAVVLESRDPVKGGWTPVSKPHFDDPTNVMLFDMAAFNGFLYAGTMNPYEGFQIWKTDAEGKPPYHWTRVISQGAYRGKRNEGPVSFCEFKGALYIGTGIYAGGHDRIYHIGPDMPELIRLYPDDSWDLLVGEPRYTPEGLKIPLSGLSAGFNNPFAAYIWRMCAHQGWLYVGTFVWSPWLPFSNKDLWPENVKRILTPSHVEKIFHEFGGFDLWRTQDGITWKSITQNGFGNPYNCGVRTMVSTPYGLFVGTVNQFGPEVAVKRANGWKYELNPRSGAEVWLGTHATLKKEIIIVPLEGQLHKNANLYNKIEINLDNTDLINEFYDYSCFRHVGFWRHDIRRPKEACENLMDELEALTKPNEKLKVPSPPTEKEIKDWLECRYHKNIQEETEITIKQEKVLDVSCGLGATTRFLLKYFKPQGITGVTNNKNDLRFCQKSDSGPLFMLMRLPKLEFPENTFDKVFCVEGIGQYGNREKLLYEIYRVLKPGGQMVCSDMLFQELKNDNLKNTTEYQKLLEMVGFKQIWIGDFTKQCAEPFYQYAQKFFSMKSLSGKIDSETIENVKALLPGGGDPIPCYLLISAKKTNN